ncbi:hypothetical protein DFA_11467 [Cavenderia fasciculata]|uniref:Uncharacterized protein n=1 Tax=Cavenderia fasciculata TaxID=261658 RepID=F4QD25_CACFS|nr:uncharacterized protein DFA_11467 [Cavenderia fasciculata]EGG13706.1 hypothetical protein DFA_11467 [Cavenderia fasciculata]|eukprot:XP_004350410.1 hypothetical protein DFA_11467 [Cavenderia fasciculata]
MIPSWVSPNNPLNYTIIHKMAMSYWTWHKRSITVKLRNQPDQQYLEIVKVIKKQRFIGDFNSLEGVYSIPEDSFSKSIQGDRFAFQNDKQVKIVIRDISKKLEDFICSSFRDRKREVYIQGPQGFGKSHSIYQVVYRLRLNPKNIVVYIPDCLGWARSINAYTFLISSMVNAVSFVQDEEDLVTFSQFLRNQTIPQSLGPLKYLISDAFKSWSEKGYQVCWFFDQYNGLTESQRSESPYCIIEGYLGGAMETYGLLVAVSSSSSANNHYFLKSALKGYCPVFEFNDGFTKEECLTYLNINNVSVSDENFELINLYTNLIPPSRQLGGPYSFKNYDNNDHLINSLDKFKHKRAKEIGLLDHFYCKEGLDLNPIEKKEFIKSIMAMILKTPIRPPHK